MARGYALAEAQKFVRVLRGEEKEDFSEDLLKRIDNIVNLHTSNLSEINIILEENRDFRKKNSDLTKELDDTYLALDGKTVWAKKLERHIKIVLDGLKKEIHKARMSIIEKEIT